MKGRVGLSQLLADVVGGDADFSMILVFDVSRWGRFQDPDQAAHYEYICREAGVSIRYCTEAFEADSSPASAIMKHVKRVMAAEFSRELAVKARAVQIANAQRGFKMGGTLPFGLRRLLIDEHGRALQVLQPGELKHIESHRIVIVPGPPEELATVRLIYKWYGIDWLYVPEMVERLNSGRYPKPHNSDWSAGRVRLLLRHEIYRGTYVFNRTRRPFSANPIANPPENWVRVKMLKPIVGPRLAKAVVDRRKGHNRMRMRDDVIIRNLRRLSRDGPISWLAVTRAPDLPCPASIARRFGTFARAVEIAGGEHASYFCLRDDGRRTSEAYLVAGLQRLLATHGYISGSLITEDPDLPSTRVFIDRFGSLLKSYAAAGWTPSRSEIYTLSQDRRADALRAARAVKVAARRAAREAAAASAPSFQGKTRDHQNSPKRAKSPARE